MNAAIWPSFDLTTKQVPEAATVDHIKEVVMRKGLGQDYAPTPYPLNIQDREPDNYVIVLVSIGDDILGAGQLLLQVSCEQHNPGYRLRLEVIPYSRGAGTGSMMKSPKYTPSTASTMLVELAEQIRTILDQSSQ